MGTLTYAKQGRREFSAVAYDESWLVKGFNVSADLRWSPGHQPHKAPRTEESVFHGALADTAPDSWGRRVIARDHARRRAAGEDLGPLTELDYLLAVDDFSRVGALRILSDDGFARTVEEGRRRTPPFVELARIGQSVRALEGGQESAEDLQYLLGKGTSLGGMRPKCTVLDRDGSLSIGKFPSLADTRSVTQGEVLVQRLARLAGIDAAEARTEIIDGIPVAIIRRFDRNQCHERIGYQSAASMLQATRDDDSSYTQIADALRAQGADPVGDIRQLWRRVVFSFLVTNTDDHLHNHGFLHAGGGLWRLAPAFDVNPFPDRRRESKTWLTPDDGPVASVRLLMERCALFDLTRDAARGILGEVLRAVRRWREVAMSAEVGLTNRDLADFAPAFEHEHLEEAEAMTTPAGRVIDQR